jgi:hypothetical protein
MIQRLFGAPSGGAHVSNNKYAPHGLGAPSLAMAVPTAHRVRDGRLTSCSLGGAQLRAERL